MEAGPEKRRLISDHFNFDIWNHPRDLLTAKEKAHFALINERFLNAKNMSPQALKKEYGRITIGLSWKSSKIEGNTHSLIDTESLLKDHKIADGKTPEETAMISGHKRAMDFIFDEPKIFARTCKNY